MTFVQLKYILTIAETKSLNKAAEQLYVSQPSLTNALKELEKEVGITIFFRTGRGVTLTNDGVEFLTYALLLSEICNKVYLIHRRAEFRGAASTLEKLEQKENVEIIRNAKVQEITGEKKTEKLLLDTGAILEIQGIFAAIGMIPQTETVKDLVALDESGYIKAGEDGITSEDGFFVAGDVRTKELRQIITAAADGANAANSAIQYIIRK